MYVAFLVLDDFIRAWALIIISTKYLWKRRSSVSSGWNDVIMIFPCRAATILSSSFTENENDMHDLFWHSLSSNGIYTIGEKWFLCITWIIGECSKYFHLFSLIYWYDTRSANEDSIKSVNFVNLVCRCNSSVQGMKWLLKWMLRWQ